MPNNNKKIKRRSKSLLTVPQRIFNNGGPVDYEWEAPTQLNFQSGLSGNNGGMQYSGSTGDSSSQGSGNSGGIGGMGIAGAISSLGPQLLSSVQQYGTKASDNAKLLGSDYAAKREKFNNDTGILGALGLTLFNDASQDLNNLENTTAGILNNIKVQSSADTFEDAINNIDSYRKQKYSFENPYDAGVKNFVKSTGQGAIAGTSILPGWGTLGGATIGSLDYLVNRTRNKNMYDEGISASKNAIREKEDLAMAAMQNNIANLNARKARAVAASAAYGGPLGVSLNPVNNALDYMQNEELLSYMTDDFDSRNKKSSLPMFAFGGALGGYGGDWSNGLSFIKAGGTHGQNPLGGVPMGIAQDGQPNLVEEGEAIWNDYVFSNRLKAPKKLLKKYKFGGDLDISFAQMVDKLQKDSAERPNDPIEKRTLDAILAELMQEQETIRQRKEERKQRQMEDMITYAANGGNLSRSKDYGSKKKPYPSVSSEDFAGGGRSYPIPTKADAIDALRLAGLHGRSDVKAKVYKKYPELKHAIGGYLFPTGGYIIPTAWNPDLQNMLDKGWKNTAIERNPYINEFNTLNNTNFTWGQIRDIIRNNNYSIQGKNSVLPVVPINENENEGLDFQTMMGNDANQFGFTASGAMAPVNLNPLDTERAEAVHSLGTPGSTELARQYWWKTHPEASNPEGPKVVDKEGAGTVTPPPVTPVKGSSGMGWQTALRYAPLLGNSIGLAYTLANKPDYEYANELEDAAREYAGRKGHVSPMMLRDYLAYNPFDRMFYANELGAQQAATRSAIMNTGNGNAGATMAGLLAAGYNSNIGLGKLFREGEEYNLAQRQKVAEFNRGTNQYNSQADLRAQMFNAEQDRSLAAMLLGAKERSLLMKQADDQAYQNALMANLTGLFQGIGDIGWEAVNRNMINSNLGLYYGMKPNGELYYKKAYYDLSPEEKAKVDSMGIQVARDGGYLTIKNRRRK